MRGGRDDVRTFLLEDRAIADAIEQVVEAHGESLEERCHDLSDDEGFSLSSKSSGGGNGFASNK